MRLVWTVAQARAAEVAAGVSEVVLIERAATALARRATAMLGRTYGSRVLILAGPGHNGADALWCGARLVDRGARVDVALPLGEPRDAHGATPLARITQSGGQVVSGANAAAYDLAIDGLLGLGARLESGAWLALTADLGDLPVLAVDVPSGVDADTGAALPDAVRATVTVTFGAHKVGISTGPGAVLAGLVEVADIGLAPASPTDVAMLDADDVARMLPMPGPTDTKYTRGVVGVVAGSAEYTGAAVLACAGAVRAGAGMVRLHADAAVTDVVRARYPEVVAVPRLEPASDRRVDAWVVGPGLGLPGTWGGDLESLLESDRPVLLDADAITYVAGRPALLKGRAAQTLLTPHTGEFARLTGVDAADSDRDRLGHARRAAADLGVTILLKGDRTVIAAPDGQARINPFGANALATAGTGDVLSGAAGALLAAGLSPLDAGAVAAWVEELTGRLLGAPLAAHDVAEHWPATVQVLCAGNLDG